MEYAGAVVDLDGTVYRGGTLVPGADRGVQALREAGVETLFVSNNPTASPETFADRLAGMGVSVAPDRILTSGSLTAAYLRDAHDGERVFVVGEAGLRDQLEGVLTTDDPTDAAVFVASLDRDVTYADLSDALRAAEAADTYVATDPDGTIPSEAGRLPGSGAVLGAVEGMTGRTPDVVAGKPSHTVADAALDRLGVPAEECLVVGDRLDTDVAMGQRAGMSTVLVLSGVTDRADLERSAVTPDAVVDSLADIENILYRS